jgi:REP element-mobilizing transposase RayT
MPTGYQIKDQEACYFLTLQIVEWVDVFSRQNYRDVIIENLKYCQANKGLQIFAFVIMSNHIHILARSETGTLSDTIRDFKSYTSKVILTKIEAETESRRYWMLQIFRSAAAIHKRNSKYQFWTQENHAVEVFSNKFIEQKVDYIHNNPVRAGIVDLSEEYLYSSARNYGDKKGILDVFVLNFRWKTV